MQRGVIVGLTVLGLVVLFVVGTVAGIYVSSERMSAPPADDPDPLNGPQLPDDNDDNDAITEPEPEPEPDIRTIRLVVAGDITAHVTQIVQAHTGNGEYDFSPSFEIIAPYLQGADLAVGNLETQQAGPDISFIGYQGYTGYPCFNAPVALSEALAGAGFDLVSMAHNHSLDRGLRGLEVTLDNVRNAGLTTFGAHLSEEEQQAPVVVEVDGIRIAFLSYTFSTNGIPVPEGHEYAVNLIEFFHTTEPIAEEIARARAAGADLVAVAMHWGEMYVTEPHPQSLRDVAREVAEAGADLILGGHPHTVQPMEWLFTDDGRPALVTYSMGNFISNQHYPANPTDLVEYGVLLQFEVVKDMDENKTWLSEVTYEVTWVHRGWRHRILPLTRVLAGEPADFNLDEARYRQLEDGYSRVKDIVEKYGFSEHAPGDLKITVGDWDNNN